MKFLDKMILCIFSVLILLMAVISSACIFGWIDATGLYVFVTKALADQTTCNILLGLNVVLILFAMLLYRLLFIAQNAPDLYGSLIVTGIFAHIALQVVLNVAVVTNTIPNTGITLPFISYGGTSILFLMAEIGIALGVSGKIKLEE